MNFYLPKISNILVSILLTCVIGVSNQSSSFSQYDYPLEIDYYKFIHYDKNRIIFPNDSSKFERFFYKMDTVITRGRGKITIIHIGGSHIQADIYSGHAREKLQAFYPGMNGGRGSVFPYKISRTNTPKSYKVKFSGSWQSCRNVELKKHCNKGLSGITVSTKDVNATLNIRLMPNDRVDYYFNKIRLFHSMEMNSLAPVFDSVNVVKTECNSQLGYTIFYLDKDYTSFTLKFEKTDSIIYRNFELYGISLENDDSGIIYHSIGINGASIPSFLRCNLLDKHIKALNPDLVVISLGTNDAYTRKFRPEFYKNNYQKLIDIITKSSPETAILCTVANDSYMFRRYPNKNTELAEKVIYEIAEKNNCGVYDFYQIMGGFNSSATWYKENLMVRDRIHFNKQGYLLKGDLFFNAIIKAYNNHITKIVELRQ